MSPPLGFVILSHTASGQLPRLVDTLNRLYDRPPIAIHHDFSQAALAIDDFPSNVAFVDPSIRTRWSHISCTYALIAALRLLYRRNAPDWFTFLSASDYPVLAGDRVVAELQRNAFDLYLDHQLVELNPPPLDDPPPSCIGSHRVEWRRMAYDRYVAKEYRYPSLTRRLTYTHRRIILRSPWLLAPFQPFASDWKCYAGDFWFTGNGKAADILMRSTTDHARTFRHFENRFCPDEALIHTILANQPGLRICNDNKRFANWFGQEAHPRTVDLGDLEVLSGSRYHFARKFAPDPSSAVLAEIDRRLGLK